MVVRLRQIETIGYIDSMFVVHSLCVCMCLYIYNYQEFGRVIIQFTRYVASFLDSQCHRFTLYSDSLEILKEQLMVVKNRTGLCKGGRSIWSMPSSDWMKSPVTERICFT